MKLPKMEKTADLILLNLLFLLSCIPVVTLGAGVCAMHHALHRWRKGEGNIPRDFLAGFKQNFRQATALWLIFLGLFGLLCLNFRIVSFWSGPVYSVFMTLLTAIGLLLLLWIGIVFPFLARFTDSTARIGTNALILALTTPVRSFCVLVLNLFPVVFAILLPKLFLLACVLWLLILCSAGGMLVQILYDPLFDKISENNKK